MNSIQKVGSYFPKDKDGYLINPAKWELVSPEFQMILTKLVDKIVAEKSIEIHSIYLRGSLPRGIDKKFISDIDLFILSNVQGLKWQSRKWSRDLLLKFKEDKNIMLDIEFFETTFDSNLAINYPQLAAIIKTQSICIYGADYADELPNFNPDKNLIVYSRWLADDLAALKGQSENGQAKKALLKVMIRVGFELVMEREEEFTPDLYWSLKSFSKYYPKKKDQMRQALHDYLNFDPNNTETGLFIDEFGNWLVKETLKKYI